MGFLDKLFTVTDDGQNVENAAPQQPSPASATQPAMMRPSSPSATVPSTPTPGPTATVSPASTNATASVTIPSQHLPVQPDMEIVKGLYQDLIDGDNNVAGSYLELKQNAEALSSMGLNETQRFIAALKIMQAKNPNLTKDDMLRSIDAYISKLDGIKTEALNQCQEKHQEILQSTATSVAKNNEIIAKHQEDIQKLQEEIDKHNQIIANYMVDIDQSKEAEAKEVSELLQTRDVFEQSVKYVETSLSNDRTIISAIN